LRVLPFAPIIRPLTRLMSDSERPKMTRKSIKSKSHQSHKQSIENIT
jgi:hypothetical protein